MASGIKTTSTHITRRKENKTQSSLPHQTDEMFLNEKSNVASFVDVLDCHQSTLQHKIHKKLLIPMYEFDDIMKKDNSIFALTLRLIFYLFGLFIVGLISLSSVTLQCMRGVVDVESQIYHSCHSYWDKFWRKNMDNKKRTDVTRKKQQSRTEFSEAVSQFHDTKSEGNPRIPLFLDVKEVEDGYEEQGKRPFLYLSYSTFKAKALIDTGANINLVDENFKNGYEAEFGPVNWQPCNTRIIAVNNHELEVVGRGSIVLQIQSDKGPLMFHDVVVYLVAVQTPVILGSNFLDEMNVTIDYRTKTLCIKTKYDYKEEVKAKTSSGTRPKVVTLMDEVTVPPQTEIVVRTKLQDNETNSSGDYLLHSDLPGPDLAFCRMQDGVMPILITNDTNQPCLYLKGQVVGTCIRKEEAGIDCEVDLNKYAAGLKTMTVSTMQKSAVCFCKLSRQTAKLVKVYFINSQMETGFRNKTANSNFDQQLFNDRTIIVRGDEMFIPNSGKNIGIMEIKNKMSNFDLDNDSFLVLTHGLGRLNLDQQAILAMMSRYTKKLTVKYFEDGIQSSLCEKHKALYMPAITHAEIVILAGKHNPVMDGIKGKDFYINEVRMSTRYTSDEKDDTLLVYVHFMEHQLKSKYVIRNTLNELTHEVRRNQNRNRPLTMSLTCTADPEANLMWKIVEGVKKIVMPAGCRLVPPRDYNNTLKWEGELDCPCLNCIKNYNSSASYKVLHHNTTVAQVCATDEKEALQELTIPEDYSIISENEYKDTTNPTPLVDTEKVEDASIDKLLQRTPKEERSWFSRVIKMFRHVIVTDRKKTKLLRDSRLLLKLNIKEPVEEKTLVFPASPVVTQRIENIFANMVAQGVAEYTDSENVKFCCPTFVRFKTPDGLAKLKKDPMADVPIRLISNYVELNKHIVQPRTILPIIKDLVAQVARHKYVFASDHQQAYRSYALAPESTDWVAISSPNNVRIRMLILLEGLSQGPEHVHTHITDSLVLSDPVHKGKQATNNKAWINDLDTLEKALQRPDNGLIAPTKTKKAIHWNDLPTKIKESKIEQTRLEQGKRDRNPQVILPEEVGPDIRVDYKSAFTYLDDGYCVANNQENFRKAILSYLIDCSNAGFLLNADKIFFGIYEGKGEATVLGYLIQDKMVKPKQNRSDPIQQMLYPKTVKQVMKFLGVVNYLSQNIDSTTLLAKPLYDKIAGKSKKETVQLDKNEKKIFDMLKDCASNPAALYLPEQEDALYLAVDASAVGVGAVLTAVSADHEIRVVGYFSKLFPKPTRMTESAVVKETAGILMALHHFRFFVHSHDVTLLSDCKAVVALLIYAKSTTSPVLFRMITKLREYPISYLFHVPGTNMIVADALSRIANYHVKTPEMVLQTKWRQLQKQQVATIPQNTVMDFPEMEEFVYKHGKELISELKPENAPKIDNDIDIDLPGDDFQEKNLHNSVIRNVEVLKTIQKTKSHEINAMTAIPPGKSMTNPYDQNLTGITSSFLLSGQAADEKIKQKITRLQTLDKTPKDLVNYSLENGVLLLKNDSLGPKIVLSETMLPKVGAAFHACGHLGMKKLTKTVAKFFTIPTAGKHVLEEIVRTCHYCQMYKALQVHDYRDGKPWRGTRAMQHLVADHIVLSKPYYTIGKPVRVIFTVMDTFSGFVWAFPQTGATTSNVIRDLLCIKSSFGPFESITMDNGAAFISQAFNEFADLNNFKVFHTLPYSSGGAGLIENKNRQIRDSLAIRMAERDAKIDTALSDTTFFLNNTLRKDAKVTTPYSIMFRRDGLQCKNGLGKNMHEQIEKELQRINRINVAEKKKIIIKEGDLVVLRMPHKMFPDKQRAKYDEKLYRVIKRRGHQLVLQNAYDRTANLKECHVKFAKRYYERNVLKNLLPAQYHNLGGDLDFESKSSENRDVFHDPKGYLHKQILDLDVDTSLHTETISVESAENLLGPTHSVHESSNTAMSSSSSSALLEPEKKIVILKRPGTTTTIPEQQKEATNVTDANKSVSVDPQHRTGDDNKSMEVVKLETNKSNPDLTPLHSPQKLITSTPRSKVINGDKSVVSRSLGIGSRITELEVSQERVSRIQSNSDKSTSSKSVTSESESSSSTLVESSSTSSLTSSESDLTPKRLGRGKRLVKRRDYARMNEFGIESD